MDVVPSGGAVLGIGVNRLSQSVALADLKDRRIAHAELNLASLEQPDEVIDRILHKATELVDEHLPDRHRLLGGTFAITGAVDPLQQVVDGRYHRGVQGVSGKACAGVHRPLIVRSFGSRAAMRFRSPGRAAQGRPG